ncbi:hypothetical protein [Aquabacter cavernae]|uniref:hypothetical protein n=1 Tax=Aquabacter cavernae TaxID=2496029 RepID=UPI000F8CA04C|nr:hypothetical protein [Aquabacter cavernae]
MPMHSGEQESFVRPPSRRVVMAGAAALALAPAVAGATFAMSAEMRDPVFAAIERHHLAYAALQEADVAEDACDAPFGSVEMRELEEAGYNAFCAEQDAFEALARTAPSTALGLSAWVTHLVSNRNRFSPADVVEDEGEVPLVIVRDMLKAVQDFAERARGVGPSA